MSLQDRPVLLIDCQTTGMHPRTGRLLGIAWTVARADSADAAKIRSFLVKIPEGEEIPKRVSAITGIGPEDMRNAVEPAEVLEALLEDVQALGEDPWAVIHYAQFEKAFLEDLFRKHGITNLPFRILCTHQIAKKVFSRLPSQNIRGLSGHFGAKWEEFKRATSHVEATAIIWKGTSAELASRGIENFDEVGPWLKNQPKTKAEPYEYRIDRLKRLELSKSPGIYRMLSKTGEVLYVGKATSLKDRVNSYFRGRKGRDKRKLEMLAQVWDLEVVECPTPLEAALMETDEIKKLNPPYNVSLKAGQRLLMFYSRDFENHSREQDADHRRGPFRPGNSIEILKLLREALGTGNFEPVYYGTIDNDVLEEGFGIFLERNGIRREDLRSLRSALAVGMRFLREHERLQAEHPESVEEELADEIEGGEETAIAPEEAAEKFERLFLRAAAELRRTKTLTRLLNARVRWQTRDGRDHWIEMQGGQRTEKRRATLPRSASPWKNLDIADYDRMSVLLSEISKHDHQIEI